MMMRAVVAVTIALVLLPGCFGKDASRTEMEAQAADAIAKFRADVLPGGRLESVHVGGWIKVETQTGGFNLKVQLSPDVDVRIGPAGEVLIDGTLASMRFTGYCDTAHIVTVTENTQQYGIPEGRIESRNPLGYCSGPGSEQLLLQAFEFQLIDPTLLTGQLYVEDMTAVGFSDVGKKKVEAEYTVEGPEGVTTLFITVHGDQVVQVIADNVDSHLVMDMTYATREAITKPAADTRVPSPVSGVVTTDEDGWHWRAITREGGPIGEYSLSIYDGDASVSCGSVDRQAIATFDLGGPALQEQAGWRLIITEDGDGKLGEGDRLDVKPPSSIGQGFDQVVVIHDDWAGKAAMLGCATPGPGIGLGALGILAAFVVTRRR